MAIGSTAKTYRFAGIASQESAAAQTGATAFVTTDARGSLATSAVGPSAIDATAGVACGCDSAVGVRACLAGEF